MNATPPRRLPRQAGPQAPHGEFMLEPPPDMAEAASGGVGQYLLYLPMIGGAGAMVFMYAGPGATPLTYAASAMYGLSSFGMVVSQFGRNSGDRGRKLDGDRRDYLRYLTQARKRIRDAGAKQREAQLWNHPDPDSLWSFAMSARRWERRPGDPDFADVRVATGSQRLAVRLVPPETKPIEDLDPISAGALRRFVGAHNTVPEMPIAVALRNYARVAFDGEPEAVSGLVRAMLAQAATFHSPEDLRVAICADTGRIAAWDWVKWLPHALHPQRRDAAGPIRMVRNDLGQIEALLGEDLAERARFRPGAGSDRAHVLVVLDGGRVPLGCQLAVGDAQGVTVLDVQGILGRATDQHVLRLRVSAETIERVTRPTGGGEERSTAVGAPDRLSLAQVDALARQFTALRISGTQADDGAPLSTRYDLPALLGTGDLRALDPGTVWQPRANRDRLRVPIGVGEDGARIELDIKEAAQGGMGPHGLVVGATGSGKSELLRTLVLGLAITHSPEQLNFVLADFKGGATFLGLEELPHVSAVITNLSDELPLVDRMQDALRGEMVRRQELLRAAGNFSSVLDYERARAQGAALTPLPSLLVVVDEFTELLTQKPEFAELFVMIGRLGRSLAVHLLLASQRLEEGRLRGLETHLSYRICLRTFSASESRTVLGVPDAHTLPSEPGHGYLKFDVTSMTRFKAAYVSGPYEQPSTVEQVRREVPRHLVPYVVDEIPLAEPAQQPAPVAAPAAETAGAPRVLDLVVARLRGQGGPAHQVWLPPLGAPTTIGALLPNLHLDPDRGLCTDARLHGRLQVPLGEVDLPFEQRRAPLAADLSGAAGHVVIVGAPQSGKSTLLRTLITGLALCHTPREAQFYGLDFGGGALGSIAGLPHVGAVATRLQTDLVRRIVAELTALLTDREKTFAERGIDSVAAYRRARPDDDPYGDVFLVVDGWGILRGEYEALEPAITNLAVRGLSYGVHVVLTAGRWAELRPALRDTIGTRYELRLGDPFESEVNRHAAANVPAGVPGRGIIKENLHFLAALPRLDDKSTVDDLADGVRALVDSVASTWPGAPAPPVRLLPELLPLAELQAAVPAGAAGLAIGLSGEDLGPATLDFTQDPHFLIFGDTESGKSNLLRTVAAEVVRTMPPDRARIIVIDTRRTLLEAVPSSHLIAFAHSVQSAESTVRDVREAMLQRVPGPDVTPEQLRDRSWWTGPELYLLVDDYDLLVTPTGSPLQPLLDVLPQSRDLGLHVILARATGGAGRSMYEPVLQRLRELGTPGIVLSGSPEEGPLIGNVAPMRLVPGRGRLHHRRHGTRLVQTAKAL
ncbi:type VII secretion protein EccCa [Rugosimonospora africana]|uniref:Type VII secretion protein EccC n=1 Tax=Rugosimonospora africana TaxID=556532 RepID=A0A8J3QYH1_9ACTN|nr:type VII secretion protein EccCa [Rugosimonospora africana]GIH18841.1 type VII secretion protein EccC [Rugosimonospora africana]